MLKKWLKRSPHYREIKHIWMGYTSRKPHQKGNLYLYYRFWINRKLRRSPKVLEKPVNTQDYTMHWLCGQRDIDQLIWALVSWYYAASEAPQMYIHSDGSITAQDTQVLHAFFPSAIVLDYAAATAQAQNTWLRSYPESQAIRKVREFPMTIKLFDPYFISPTNGVLIVDTDILWFHEPTELFTAIHHYTTPTFWQEHRPAPYILPNGEALRADLLVCNGGLIYYQKSDFQFAIIEEFLQKRGGFHGAPFGFNEQIAFSYLFGQYGEVALLPMERYPIKGKLKDSTAAIHYTAPRRPMFWAEGVRYLQKTHALC